MNKSIIYIFSLALICMCSACERVVDINLPDGDAIPYIDAWITNKPGMQTIKFLKASNYMSTDAPVPISDAQVVLTDITQNTSYNFVYSNGAYNYNTGAAGIGIIGHLYRLSITYKGAQFIAIDTMKRNTKIDSLTYEFKKEASDHKEGYFAKLWAKDLPGASDYYWIRTYKNGKLNYDVGEMVSIDGSFDENITDGFEFIPPFRDGITADDKPYVLGDQVKVIIRSISKSSHGFMEQTVNQLDNGGLFARVLQNVPANMQNQQAGNTTRIYGWFGMTAEVADSIKIQ